MSGSTCSGSGTGTYTVDGEGNCSGPIWNGNTEVIVKSCCGGGPDCIDGILTATGDFPCNPTLGCYSCNFDNSDDSTSNSYSNEYTTNQLIFNTIAALPAYDDVYDDSCSASRNLSSDELSYSIQRFKYKFTFSSAVEAFTIYWTERFSPSGGGSFTDTDKSESQAINDTESNVFEVDEPNSNGSITIVNIRWSLDATVCGVSQTPCGDPPILVSSSCDPSTTDCTSDYDNCCVECCSTDTC